MLVWSLALTSAYSQVNGFLTVRIVEGDNAFNDIKRKEAHRPAVEVRDEANNPVVGAEVVFALPTIGAGGMFLSGKTTSTAMTDAQGVARSEDFKPNNDEGRFNIRVTATYQGRKGSVVISQTNTLAGGESPTQGGGHKKLILVLLIVGAAAGVGVAFGASGSKSSGSPAPTPTVLSSGGITVGGPN